MAERNYNEFVKKNKTKKRFEKDLKKRRYSFLGSLVFFIGVVFLTVSTSEDTSSIFITKSLLIPGIILLVLSVILMFYFANLSLTKKEFLVYAFYIMAEEIRTEDYEEKRMKQLINGLVRSVKIGTEEGKDPFNYVKINKLKRDIKKFTIYLKNKFAEGGLEKFSNVLTDLSVKIYNEDLEGSFAEKIIKAHGEAQEKISPINLFLKKGWKYILAIILGIALLVMGILLKISTETLYLLLGGSIIGGIIVWLITKK